MTSPALSAAHAAAYLQRLHLSAPGPPTLEALCALHRAHLLQVPFENLDIHLGRALSLELPDLFDKVVDRRRGGYCYELNSLFAALLRTLGYEVSFLSARVVGDGGEPGPAFDHLALRVTSPALPGAVLADVGFGDAFLEPLVLSPGVRRQEGSKVVGLERTGTTWTYLEDRGRGPEAHYLLTEAAFPLQAFQERHVWQQTAPDSHFRRQPLCTRATAEGRLTLAGCRLIQTDRAGRTEQLLAPAARQAVLRDQFGVRLDQCLPEPTASLP